MCQVSCRHRPVSEDDLTYLFYVSVLAVVLVGDRKDSATYEL